MNNQQIIDFYLSGKSLAATSRFSGLSTYKLHQLFEKNNIAIRTRHEQNILENMRRGKSINHNFFNTLNNENVYYLGFIAADGTVRPNRNEIKIGLSSIDRKFLEEFKEKLQSERTIKDYVTSNGFNISELIFSSLKIKEDLKKYNIVPNKTVIGVSMANIPEELKLAFIKGFFDGDGCFCYLKNTNQCKITFTSYTCGILNEINEFFDNKGYIYSRKNGGICYELTFSTTTALKIMKEFYNLNTPCLLRKKEKYEEALKLRIKI